MYTFQIEFKRTDKDGNVLIGPRYYHFCEAEDNIDAERQTMEAFDETWKGIVIVESKFASPSGVHPILAADPKRPGRSLNVDWRR